MFHLTLAAPLVLMGYFYLEAKHEDWEAQMQGNDFVILSCFAASVLLMAFVFLTYRKSVMQVRERDNTNDKFQEIFPVYRNFYIGSLAVALLLSAGYYFTGAPLLIGTYLVELFGLSLMRPAPGRYIRDLQLSKAEARLVRKKELTFQE